MSIKQKKSMDETNITSTGNSISINSGDDRYYITNNEKKDHYSMVLPQNIDIFSGILKKAKNIADPQIYDYVLQILLSLNNTLHQINQTDIIKNNLSKLNLSIMSDESVLIEWNFENFRIGFSIEPNLSESSYYVVSDDKISGAYSSEANLLTPVEVDSVIQNIINFVLRNT